MMIIVPTREIELGEEITLTYLEDAERMCVEQRRESLMNDFGFWCECELCRAEGGNEMILEEVDSVAVEGDGEAVPEATGYVQEERHIRNGSPVKERPAWKSRW